MLGQRIFDWLFKKSPLRFLVLFTKKLVLPGFDDRPLYDVLKFFFRGLQQGAIDTRAASVAFKFFLALFPGLIFLFSLVPYLPIHNFREELLLNFEMLLPGDANDMLVSTLDDLLSQERGGILSIGILLTLYFASNGISSLLRAFNLNYYSRTTLSRTWIVRRLLSVVLFVIITTFIITGVALIIFGQTILNYIAEHVWDPGTIGTILLSLGKWLVIVALIYMAISLLFTFGQARGERWKFFSAGSSLATASVIVLSLGFAWYVGNFANYNKLYGSIGALIILMLWIYYNCFILIIGYDLNISIQQAGKHEPLPDSSLAQQGE